MAAMRLAAEDLCGTHDFRAFCSLKKFKRSTGAPAGGHHYSGAGAGLQFTFTRDGFLYHMVRILVGTLLAVGRGRNPRDTQRISWPPRTVARQGRPSRLWPVLEEVRYTR